MTTPNKPRALINCSAEEWNRVYHPETASKLQSILEFDSMWASPVSGRSMPEEELLAQPGGSRVVLGTWWCGELTPRVLDRHPDLELIVHGAGSIKPFYNSAIAERGIKVCSAVHINAQPVAEFCLGNILAALKDLCGWKNKLIADGREDGWNLLRYEFIGGYYKTKIGLIGFGEISKQLMKLLKGFDFEVFISSKYFSEEDEKEYGAKQASMEWIMENCEVISLHSANTSVNRHMINGDNLKLMKDGAIFINTARGALVNERDLVHSLRTQKITAYLDVTDPEPPSLDHPFYELPNCYLTPHISGSTSFEVYRLGDYVLREIENFLANRPLENELCLEQVLSKA